MLILFRGEFLPLHTHILRLRMHFPHHLESTKDALKDLVRTIWETISIRFGNCKQHAANVKPETSSHSSMSNVSLLPHRRPTRISGQIYSHCLPNNCTAHTRTHKHTVCSIPNYSLNNQLAETSEIAPIFRRACIIIVGSHPLRVSSSHDKIHFKFLTLIMPPLTTTHHSSRWRLRSLPLSFRRTAHFVAYPTVLSRLL